MRAESQQPQQPQEEQQYVKNVFVFLYVTGLFFRHFFFQFKTIRFLATNRYTKVCEHFRCADGNFFCNEIIRLLFDAII